MKPVRQIFVLVVLMVVAGSSVARLAAQGRPAVNGTVFDQTGGAIVGAKITVRDSAGIEIQTTTSDANGAFSMTGLPAGKYDVVAESDLFEPALLNVEISSDGAPKTVRLTLNIAGLTDSVVVTARRVESKLSETPQEIQLVTSEDIERSVAVDLTDVLKKNSGVDVIQYPGLLSGIGMRGFNPEFSGINKHTLLLIDGRPSGVTNLASLMLDNVDHVEVMKGPASAIYGASAMGGVVNVITKRSRGELFGNIDAGLASFGTTDITAKMGGSISSRLDFDASLKLFDQRNDYHVGSGVDRRAGYRRTSGATMPYSSYRNNDGWLRLGAILSPTWLIDGRVNLYQARDVLNPGDVFFDGNQQSSKDFDRDTSDVRLQGQLGSHMVSTTVYTANESNHSTRVTSTNAAERPFLPYLMFEGSLKWTGAQIQDGWNWHRNNNLVFGFDSELARSRAKQYLPTGVRTGPKAADNTKRTAGIYAENTLNINNGSTVISAGGRVDNIKVETFDTPFKTGFTPSATTFTVFNPSFGVKQLLTRGIRAHGTIGRAFVPADAAALTGFSENIVGGRRQISQGNPNLKPERSLSFDMGIERASTSMRLDMTYFQTAVTNRIVSNVVISNPAPPAPVVVSYVNALSAHMRGMDLDFDQRLTAHTSVFGSVTHYFTRKEQLPAASDRDINVIAANSVRAGFDFDFRSLTSRISARYLQGRKDLDFNTAGNPQIRYEDFATVDVNAVYHLTAQHSVSVAVNNLFDRYYYEKLGFPLPGRTLTIRYGINIGRPESRR